MLLPTKHENLKRNTLVLGAEVIRFIKNHGESPIENIFQNLKDRYEISIDIFYDVIVFLWIVDFITLADSNLSLNK
jgi:hypothetical protein